MDTGLTTMDDTDELQHTDDKGRPFIEDMTDRQVLVEILATMRFLADAMGQIQSQGLGGIMKSMLGGKGS